MVLLLNLVVDRNHRVVHREVFALVQDIVFLGLFGLFLLLEGVPVDDHDREDRCQLQDYRRGVQDLQKLDGALCTAFMNLLFDSERNPIT